MAVALPDNPSQTRMLMLRKEEFSECAASPRSCAFFPLDAADMKGNQGGGVGSKAQGHLVNFGTKSVKGRRPNMEDFEKVVSNLVFIELPCYEKEGLIPKALENQSTVHKLISKRADTISPRSCHSLVLSTSGSEDSQEICNSFSQPRRRVLASAFIYAAVFDGHGGSAVSSILSNRLHMVLQKELEQAVRSIDHLGSIMKQSFVKMDAELGDAARTAGSTGVVCLVSRHHIVVANCGDSRGVLWRENELVRLTRDHKPSYLDEEARIVKAGGRVCNYNGIRVMGLLAMSRAFGDHCLSEFGIIPEPEVTIIERSEDDDFIILASDGLWDVVSDAEACALTSRCFARAQERSASKDAAARVAANVLVRVALDKGSSDNITAVVLDLRASK